MIKIAIAEDNKHLRETLELLINGVEDFECTFTASNGEQILQLVKKHSVDVILMDIEMPGTNGIEATRQIKKAFPDVSVLIQTVFYEDEYIFDAICAGASGYILKNSSPAEYIDAIIDINAGGSPMTPGIARRVLTLFQEKMMPVQSEDYNLTRQEKNVLSLLKSGKSYKMIAAELSVSMNTIKTHMRNIYAKLHVNSGTEAVSKAIQERIVSE